jgi:hypothetical protein
MPLASLPGRPDLVYGFGRIDASGRVADRGARLRSAAASRPRLVIAVPWLPKLVSTVTGVATASGPIDGAQPRCHRPGGIVTWETAAARLLIPSLR